MVRLMFFIAIILVLIIVTLIIIDLIKKNKDKEKMRERAEIFKKDDIVRIFLEELYSMSYPSGRKRADGFVSIFSFIERTKMDIEEYKRVFAILRDNHIIIKPPDLDRVGFTPFGLELFKNFISEKTS